MSELRIINATRMLTGEPGAFDKNLEYCDGFDLDEWINSQPTINPESLPIVQELRKKLARYEKAEQENRLIELPCQIGSTVFWRYMDCERPYKPGNCSDHKGLCDTCSHKTPVAISIQFDYKHIPLFGEKVFLTKEEAEQKE